MEDIIKEPQSVLNNGRNIIKTRDDRALILVDKDGKITAMGEQVKKVLVDGEEFFGDDPGIATKNLRADVVKEVEVFDIKSGLISNLSNKV